MNNSQILEAAIKKRNQYGKNNPSWKGDSVGYVGLHDWVKTQLKRPNKCSHCNKEKKLDLANISGIYNRDTKNWLYLCRSCHLKHEYKHEGRQGFAGKRHSETSKQKTSESIKKWWERRKNSIS